MRPEITQMARRVLEILEEVQVVLRVPSDEMEREPRKELAPGLHHHHVLFFAKARARLN